ncbi:MAG: nitroreductase family protein [Bacteroidota bacterium]
MSSSTVHTSNTDLAYPIDQNQANRWSPYDFEPHRPIPDEHIKQLFEAARWAPSSFNAQPWRYLYAHQGEPGFDRIFKLLMPGNQTWAKDASLLILSLAKLSLDSRPGRNGAAAYDTGAANLALVLQATSLGLHVHQMGGFDRQAAQEEFKLDTDLEPRVVLAVGYLGAEGQAKAEGEFRKARLTQEAFTTRL